MVALTDHESDNPVSEMRRILGERFEICESEILFDGDVLERAEGIELRIRARLLGFDKVQKTMTWHQPRTWRDYVKKGLKIRWPRLFKRLKVGRVAIHEEYDFYGKVCPHLGNDPSRNDCITWVTDTLGPARLFK